MSKIGTSMYSYRAHGKYFVLTKVGNEWGYVIGLDSAFAMAGFKTRRAAYQGAVAKIVEELHGTNFEPSPKPATE